MKKNLFLASAFAGALLIASCGNSGSKVEESQQAAEAGQGAVSYTIDSAASTVNWFASKVTGKHDGTLAIKSGDIQTENGTVSAGKIVFDMTQIVVTDVTDAEMNGKLTGHLKSDDFFSVETHPEATFEIVSVEPIAEAAEGTPNYSVKGNLTIKGITKAITFPATINVTEGTLNAAAEVEIDRTEWDIRYGSGKFFENIGDKAIHDNFKVNFNVTAKA